MFCTESLAIQPTPAIESASVNEVGLSGLA